MLVLDLLYTQSNYYFNLQLSIQMLNFYYAKMKDNHLILKITKAKLVKCKFSHRCAEYLCSVQ